MTSAHPVPDPLTPPPAPTPARHRGLRRGLSTALVIGLVADLVTVITLDDPVYSSGIGGFVLLCAAALGVLALRHSPRGGAA